MTTLEHKLRMLKVPILDDGVVNLGETTLLLRAVSPYVNQGDALADELQALLLQVRGDGVITPDESARIVRLLNEITVERPKRLRAEAAMAAARQHLARDGR